MNGHVQNVEALISGLAASVQRFHERFGIVGPVTQAELLSRIPIQEEEVRELQQAVLGEPPDNQAAEAVDVLYVAIGTVLRLDAELATRAIRQVIAKNDAKTLETHHVNAAGKVTKRKG
ncbi:MAG: hypothetical protein HY681_06855 [Chloroflexi bacterium]|nr:hypothetical protein [Chloroflexota bacterium]